MKDIHNYVSLDTQLQDHSVYGSPTFASPATTPTIIPSPTTVKFVKPLFSDTVVLPPPSDELGDGNFLKGDEGCWTESRLRSAIKTAETRRWEATATKEEREQVKAAAAAKLLQVLLYGEADDDPAIAWDLVLDDIDVNARVTKWLNDITIQDAAYEGGNHNIASIVDASPELCSLSQFGTNTEVHPSSFPSAFADAVDKLWNDDVQHVLNNIVLREEMCQEAMRQLEEREQQARWDATFYLRTPAQAMGPRRFLVGHGAPFTF